MKNLCIFLVLLSSTLAHSKKSCTIFDGKVMLPCSGIEGECIRSFSQLHALPEEALSILVNEKNYRISNEQSESSLYLDIDYSNSNCLGIFTSDLNGTFEAICNHTLLPVRLMKISEEENVVEEVIGEDERFLPFSEARDDHAIIDAVKKLEVCNE